MLIIFHITSFNSVCYNALFWISVKITISGYRENILIIIYNMYTNNYNNFKDIPTTVGSKSTKTARGTCFPDPVSQKKVLKDSSEEPTALSLGICPSG